MPWRGRKCPGKSRDQRIKRSDPTRGRKYYFRQSITGAKAPWAGKRLFKELEAVP